MEIKQNKQRKDIQESRTVNSLFFQKFSIGLLLVYNLLSPEELSDLSNKEIEYINTKLATVIKTNSSSSNDNNNVNGDENDAIGNGGGGSNDKLVILQNTIKQAIFQIKQNRQ